MTLHFLQWVVWIDIWKVFVIIIKNVLDILNHADIMLYLSVALGNFDFKCFLR